MGYRFLQFSRKLSLSRAVLSSSNKSSSAAEIQHHESAQLWKKLTIFGAVPATILSVVNAILSEEPEPPEFIKYPHLRIRNKPYPWRDGVKTLFHNPHTNALPDGYEDVAHH